MWRTKGLEGTEWRSGQREWGAIVEVLEDFGQRGGEQGLRWMREQVKRREVRSGCECNTSGEQALKPMPTE